MEVKEHGKDTFNINRIHQEAFLFFNCNYDVSDYAVSSQFYNELLLWWSQFRETFVLKRDWRYIIWNNKEILIDNTPIFYKNYFESGKIFLKLCACLAYLVDACA